MWVSTAKCRDDARSWIFLRKLVSSLFLPQQATVGFVLVIVGGFFFIYLLALPLFPCFGKVISVCVCVCFCFWRLWVIMHGNQKGEGGRKGVGSDSALPQSQYTPTITGL